MKKFLFIFISAVMLLFPLSAFSAVTSEYDAKTALKKISQVINLDFSTMINKGDLIGNRLETYNLLTTQYKRTLQVTSESVSSLVAQAQIIQNSEDYAESDKVAEIQKIYMQIDSLLYNLDFQTFDFIMNTRRIMPTITYQKFVRKFQSYYNDLNISGNSVNVGM